MATSSLWSDTSDATPDEVEATVTPVGGVLAVNEVGQANWKEAKRKVLAKNEVSFKKKKKKKRIRQLEEGFKADLVLKQLDGGGIHGQQNHQESTPPLWSWPSVNAAELAKDIGVNRLHHAVKAGDIENVEALLDEYPELIEEEDQDQDSFRCAPLQVAAYHGHLPVVQLLLQRRAKVHAVGESEMRWQALHLAGLEGHKDIVEFLLQSRADCDQKDTFGRTALELAKSEAGKHLITYGARDIHKFKENLVVILQREGHDATDIVRSLLVEAVAVSRRQDDDPKGLAFEYWTQKAPLAERLHVVLSECYRSKDPLRRGSLKATEETRVLLENLKLRELAGQNLLHTPEIKVQLKVLQYLDASLACDIDLLRALATTANEDTLATDTVTAIISAAWLQTRGRVIAEIMLNGINVILLCYVSFGFRNQKGSAPLVVLKVLICIHMKMVLEELAQQLEALGIRVQLLWTRRSEKGWIALPPFLDVDNLADLAYQVVGCVALFRQLDHAGLEKPFMAIFSACAWLRFCSTLRGEPWFGLRILPIISALRDTVGFFFFAFVCVCAATHAYYNLQVRDEDYPIYDAFLQVVRLGLFADFDLFEFQGTDPIFKQNNAQWEPEDPSPKEMGDDYIYIHIIFFGTGICITILLMNLLIGVLGSNFDLYQDHAPQLFNQARAKFLLEIRSRPFGRCLGWLRRRSSGPAWVGQLASCVYAIGYCLQAFFHLVLILCTLPLFCSLVLFCSWSGLCLTFVKLVEGAFGRSTEGCYIWVLQREEPEELRSIHALVKEQINDVKKTQEERFAEIDSKLSRLTQLVENKSVNRGSSKVSPLLTPQAPKSPQSAAQARMSSFVPRMG
ncbi:unnamed protein product [Durusdinium trenchii]|uniref:Serine/threonine-protein phosphatase 6 regulatory ankyrin repeat subunit C (PP6-ARS-C) (Serine/threonine-protein phosphatase 6 regulatory subunit ARS-C) n=2 Tax=Durusdinium trenchii TaxID=1381693 RepID=A0ABP0QCL3_9DINO